MIYDGRSSLQYSWSAELTQLWLSTDIGFGTLFNKL